MAASGSGPGHLGDQETTQRGEEPLPSPCLGLPQVVSLPHYGASFRHRHTQQERTEQCWRDGAGTPCAAHPTTQGPRHIHSPWGTTQTSVSARVFTSGPGAHLHQRSVLLLGFTSGGVRVIVKNMSGGGPESLPNSLKG